jgi:ribosomal protein L21E
MTSLFTLRYIDYLPDITNTLNSRKHRSINMAPKDVSYKNQRDVVKFILKSREKEVVTRYKTHLKVGDHVRIALNKSLMDKSYTPNWSDEIYEIVNIKLGGTYPMYQIRDYKKKTIEGNFYNYELQKVVKDDNETLYRVEKVLKKRKRNGVREVFVLWKNFGPEHASWIPESDLETS